MGHWIKENKFEAGLLLVVALVAVGVYVLGGGQGKKYTEARDYYAVAVQQKSALESKSPYPSDANEKAYGKAVDDYRGVIEGLQEKLLTFRPAEFKQIAPSDFTDKLSAKRDALAQRYTAEKIEFPEDKWQLGFERYTATPPRDEATAYLSYQLDGLDWLFGTLADVRPTALINVVRKELPVESGKPMDGESTDRRPRSRTSTGSGKPFHVLPMELTFKASEPAVREFLSKVVSNDKYFFVIRTLRVQNEKRGKPPKKDDVDFDAGGKDGAAPFDSSFDLIVPEGDAPAPEGDTPAPEGDAPGEQPLFPTDPPEEAPPADEEEGGDRILGQILGGEEIFVFLQLDLLLFKEKEESGMPIAKAKKGN